MPAGYSNLCKICNSSHRTIIESWKEKDKLSYRDIKLKAKEELDEDFSLGGMSKHFTEHYNVLVEAQEQYVRSQTNIERDARDRVSDIQILDDVIQGKYRMHQSLEKILKNQIAGLEDSEEKMELPKIPMTYVSLYTGCAAEIRQTMKQKAEALGEVPAGVNVILAEPFQAEMKRYEQYFDELELQRKGSADKDRS